MWVAWHVDLDGGHYHHYAGGGGGGRASDNLCLAPPKGDLSTYYFSIKVWFTVDLLVPLWLYGVWRPNLSPQTRQGDGGPFLCECWQNRNAKVLQTPSNWNQLRASLQARGRLLTIRKPVSFSDAEPDFNAQSQQICKYIHTFSYPFLLHFIF